MDGEACYCHSNGKQCHVENLLGNYKFTIWQQCKIRIRDAESQRIIVWLNTAYNYLTVVSMIKVHDRNSIFSEEANYLTVGSLGHSPILRASVPGSDSGWRWWQDLAHRSVAADRSEALMWEPRPDVTVEPCTAEATRSEVLLRPLITDTLIF